MFQRTGCLCCGSHRSAGIRAGSLIRRLIACMKPFLRSHLIWLGMRRKTGTRMSKTIACAVLALALTSSAARAGERVGDAALGALSGALVLGPIGAVGGAVIGYSAGPSIAHSWGLRRSSTNGQARRAASRDTRAPAGDNQPVPNSQPAPKDEAAPQAAAPTRQPATTTTASTAPPVQPLE